MKKVVYVEINEEITSIYDRVRTAKSGEIYLVVPIKAMLFQSVINLSILKSKLEELQKKLIVITTDPVGQHMSRRLGMEYYERIEVKKKAPEEVSPQNKNQPIQARRNEVVRDVPKRFTEKKMTLKELIHELRTQTFDKKEAEGVDYSFMRPNRKFLFLILLVSVGLFGLISYLALSGATIYIKPKFDSVTYTANVILADQRKNQRLLREYNKNVVASQEIDTVLHQTKLFNTISKEFEGVSARGKITVVNAGDQEWTFKAGTRFQNSEGLIFRIRDYVVAPSATVDPVTGTKKNGEIVVPVMAADVDIYNNIIGERGNIGPATFSIPGLSKTNQKSVWAVSKEVMKGGLTKYRKIVKAEDIDAAKKEMESNLLLMAREDLKTHIDEANKANQTHLVLLSDPRYLKVSIDEMRLPEDLEGSYRDKFEIFAKISVRGIAFDFEQLFVILSQEIKGRSHPDKVINMGSLTSDSIEYSVVDFDAQSGQIKITATIKGIEEFVFNEENPAGLRLSQKIKEKVAGLTVEEAQNVISNLPEVERVKIRMSPIWLKKMPPLGDNIAIRELR